VRRGLAAPVAVLAAALALAACGGDGTPAGAHRLPAPEIRPQRILPAPSHTLAATAPQPDGALWVLAGPAASRGLFELDAVTGRVLGSVPVSGAARSVAETQTGIIGLALGTRRAGALELLDGTTGKAIRTIPLPAPARQVVTGSDGTTFYVLGGWPNSSSVTIVNSRSGRVQGTVPVPLDAVSVAPDIGQSTLYVLQRDGRVSEIAVAGGQVTASFVIGDSGQSLALSPDGTTLYALKDTSTTPNVAAVDVATESVRRVLPAPVHCLEVLVSASGAQLYDVVGTAAYGNVQVFAA
jgi:DNA-binding beta-propeller fold protein YncE